MMSPAPSPGGPSHSHELRRVELDTFARHLGFHLPVPFPDGSRPDVALVHTDRRALFIGDAKHTERPTSRDTHARLSVYSSWLGSAPGSGPDLFALAYPPGAGPGWAEVLVDLVVDAGLTPGRPWIRRLSPQTEVVLVSVSRIVPGPSDDRLV